MLFRPRRRIARGGVGHWIEVVEVLAVVDLVFASRSLEHPTEGARLDELSFALSRGLRAAKTRDLGLNEVDRERIGTLDLRLNLAKLLDGQVLGLGGGRETE